MKKKSVLRGTSVAAIVAVLSVVLAACGSSSSSGSSKGSSSGKLSGKITVFAAASLTGAFTQLGEQFKAAHPGTKVVFDFGSSGDLATSITQGGSADVFASAAPTNMASVVSAGDASSSTNFVSNTAEIATPPGNPKGVKTLKDLAKPGVRVALCVPTAPCGALALQLFQKAGVTVKPTASEPDVKTTLGVVQSGEVDAGIVYVTDVKAAGSKVTGVPIPASSNGTTEYPIATLTHAKNPALAKAFVAYVRSADGQKVLKAAGFLAP